jgi:hypothetical protein
MAKSGTALKALRCQRKPNKRAARRNSGEKVAQPTLKERLAALSQTSADMPSNEKSIVANGEKLSEKASGKS